MIGECWSYEGQGFINRAGYGQVHWPPGGPPRSVHRVVYEELVGPIPEGLELDHVKARGCTMRSCYNPLHLEPVTGAENRRRGRNFWSEKTHCPHNHPYDEANTYRRPSGGRACRACNRALKSA